MKPTILVTGAGGQLGQSFASLAAREPEWSWRLADRRQLDITRAADCYEMLAASGARYCFNTAAYTAVDKAESEPDLARAVNADGPAALAEACVRLGVHLIHFSTDYVYAGHYNRPLREDDELAPAGVYAATKLAGEQAVLERMPQATILRTSWVYAQHGHNFFNTMLRLGKERDQLRIVFDQVGSPTLADDLAAAALHLIRHNSDTSQLAGVFNYSHEGVCSWYDFAMAIFELAGIRCALAPIESKDYPTPARRPHYSVLNKEKIKSAFGLEIPHWREALATLFQERR
jgi:dTDP-4-dehydrorhamnose reductase